MNLCFCREIEKLSGKPFIAGALYKISSKISHELAFLYLQTCASMVDVCISKDRNGRMAVNMNVSVKMV